MPILLSALTLPQHQLLLRLFWMRCIATLAQVGIVAAAYYGMRLHLPLLPLCTVVLVMTLVNALTWLRMRRAQPVHDLELFLQLFLDVTALSALLYFTGGATNPFVSFYLPALAVAAAILPSAYAFILAIYALACYSTLTYLYQPLHVHDSGQAMAYHLGGMWLNFLVSAALITWFVTRMSASVRARDTQLAQAREQQLQDERIVALGTQAASAAHEMSTPLATVAVIAGELRIDAQSNPALRPYKEDLALIEEQVVLCKTALDRMGMDIHVQRAAVDAPVKLNQWLQHFVDTWRLRHPAVVVSLVLPDETVPVSDQQLLGQVLLTLFDNAAAAIALRNQAAEQGKMSVVLTLQASEIMICISDNGPGIPAQLRKRLGYEPVRSTTGGKGIGLMLAFATARQMGAKLSLSGNEEGGASATVILNRSPR